MILYLYMYDMKSGRSRAYHTYICLNLHRSSEMSINIVSLDLLLGCFFHLQVVRLIMAAMAYSMGCDKFY